MSKNRLLLIALLLLVPLASLPAQDVDVTKLPGYINLDKIKIPGNNEDITEINLGPGLLSLLASFSDEADSAINGKLKGLISLRVKSFPVNGKRAEEIRPIMEEFDKKLRSEKWEEIVRVKKGKEFTVVSYLPGKNKVSGFFIMSLTPDEDASFINIVGNIDVAQLSKMGLGISDSTMRSIRTNWRFR